MDYFKQALIDHKEKQGKIEIKGKMPVTNIEELSIAYTPGVAEPCKEIHNDVNKVYDYTSKGNLVAVVSNGTAVLGLGDIGAHGAIPVMEGKAVLFKSFGNVDAFPICLPIKDTDKLVEVIESLEPVFGGINLEDIKAPECFEIEARLKKSMNIPIFHDDQHGTAIVVLAGLINALKVASKKIEDVKIVINGAGAAAVACAKLMMEAGATQIILNDRTGAIYEGRAKGMNPFKEEIAKSTNQERIQGTLADTLVGADVFIGLSEAGTVSVDMIKSMNDNAIVFAMANPIPEIMPDLAKEGGAVVIATGRSDFPNQINNVLAFPGVFRGALDVRARDINEEMKLSAAYALADIITDEERNPDYIIPNPFDKRVATFVAEAVKKAARDTGVARL